MAGSMLETVDRPGRGCTFPVTMWSLKQGPALARRPGRYNPMRTEMPGPAMPPSPLPRARDLNPFGAGYRSRSAHIAQVRRG
jgi:hypothetical protein